MRWMEDQAAVATALGLPQPPESLTQTHGFRSQTILFGLKQHMEQ